MGSVPSVKEPYRVYFVLLYKINYQRNLKLNI